jgi:hypothetical protein
MTQIDHLEKPKYTFNGIYRGLVEDNDDPLDAGRVKLRIFGVNDNPEITVEELPWAEPALNMFWSGGYNLRNEDKKLAPGSDAYHPGSNSKVAGTDLTENSVPQPGPDVFSSEKMDPRWNACGTGGQFVVPKKGNIVFLFFEGGNPMCPIYFAMATNARDWRTQRDARDSEIQQKLAQLKEFENVFKQKETAQNANVTAPQTGENWADNALVDSKVKTPDINILPIISENPNKDVYCVTSPNGTTIIIDNSKANEKLYIIHKNTIDHIDNQGNKKLYVGRSHNKASAFATETDSNIPCNYEVGVEGNHEVYIAGKWKVYALDDIGIKSQANIQIESAKNVGISVKNGDIDLIVQKGNLNANINGNINANVEENANINVKKNCNMKITGNVNATIGGEVNLKATQNINLSTTKDLNVSVNGNFKLSATSVDFVTPSFKVSGEANIGGNTKITGTLSATQDVIAGQVLYSSLGVDTAGFLRNRGPADIGSPVIAHVLQVVGGAGTGTGRPPTPPVAPSAPTEPKEAIKEPSSTEVSLNKEKVVRQTTPEA